MLRWMTFSVTRILGALICVALATMGFAQSQQTASANAERTIAERLAREGDDYDARVAVLTMTERELAARQDRETSARLSLLRLRALARVLEKIPFGKGQDQPYVAFLRANYGRWDYDEPGGAWLVRHEAIVALHDEYHDTKAAEPIAWFMLKTGLEGECEGYLACYVRCRNALDGKYLRWHPDGAHAIEVVAGVKSLLESLSSGMLPPDSFDPRHDCKELMDAVVPLRAAVSATRSPDRSVVIAGLDKLATPCR
jgi:hypothetical protein